MIYRSTVQRPTLDHMTVKFFFSLASTGSTVPVQYHPSMPSETVHDITLQTNDTMVTDTNTHSPYTQTRQPISISHPKIHTHNIYARTYANSHIPFYPHVMHPYEKRP
jgi:hypothetical protein